jgi:YrbI family 3-deoxy-D-manno-octulosonate 8-phosphate phosphatase
VDGVVSGRSGALALIPARGGSKGIPRKNVRSFGGHPLIAYSIAAGLGAGRVERVIVSTDDPEIADVAKQYGAEVPFLRPADLGGDDVPDLPVFDHALRWLGEEEGYRPDLVVHLRPTTPLRPLGMVDQSVDALAAAPGADSLRAVAPAAQNPFKMWTLEDATLRPLVGDTEQELYNQPRQRLPQAYWQTGMIDVTRARTVLELRSMTGRTIHPFLVDARLAVDLDSEDQWEQAERSLALWGPDVERPPGDLSSVRLVVFDFDGVFTDNLVSVSDDGRESVRASRGDGMGISRLLEAGLDAVVVTSEVNPVATVRCGKLGISCRHTTDKAGAVSALMRERDVPAADVAYVGNDVNDLEAMQLVGWPVAVSDAHVEVKRAARLVLRRPGGDGAVRELCDLLVSGRKELG